MSFGSAQVRRSEASRRRWVPIVAIAVVLALGVAGAVLVTRYLAVQQAEQEAQREQERQQRLQEEEADAAAERFFEALTKHEEVWDEQTVLATFGAGVALAVGQVDPAVGRYGGASALAERCTEQAEAVAAFEDLRGSTRPELAPVQGTSARYESARSAAQQSQRLAQAERDYLDQGLQRSEDLLAHCRAWAGQTTALQEQAEAFATAEERFMVAGGQSQREDNWVMQCGAGERCWPLARSDREALADAMVSHYTRAEEIAQELYGDFCAEGYREYCDLELEVYALDRDRSQAAADRMRGPLQQGDTALPGFDEAVQSWREDAAELRSQAQDSLRRATAPGAGGASHFGPHHAVVIEQWENDIAELARATLERGHADQA